MDSRILAAELPAQIGQRVTIAGWLHRRRELKSVTFLIVRDRSGLAQVVLRNPADAHQDSQEQATAETRPAAQEPPTAGPARPPRSRRTPGPARLTH